MVGPFLIPLILSVAAHAALLFGPHFTLPGSDPEEDPAPIVAHLVPPQPKAAEAPSKPPAPRRKPVHKPAPPPAHAAAPSPVLMTRDPVPDSVNTAREAPVPKPEDAPATPVPPVAAPAGRVPQPAPVLDAARFERLPGAALLRYRVIWGGQGMEVGAAEHRWTRTGNTYELRATLRTIGLAALLRGASVTQTSRGALEAATGLHPRDYRAEHGDNAARTEAVTLDTEGRVARFTGRDPHEEPLPEGTQDLLSFLYQLGGVVGEGAKVGDSFSLPVATGRKLSTHILEVAGDEAVETGLGPRRVFHLKARSDGPGGRMEIWLAQDALRLPVRILYEDRGGQLFDLRIVELDIDHAEAKGE